MYVIVAGIQQGNIMKYDELIELRSAVIDNKKLVKILDYEIKLRDNRINQKKSAISNYRLDGIRELRKEGKTFQYIANKYGYALSTIHNIVNFNATFKV